MNLAVGDPAINQVGLEFPFTSLTLLQFCILPFLCSVSSVKMTGGCLFC
jgi:hypothetical protein